MRSSIGLVIERLLIEPLDVLVIAAGLVVAISGLHTLAWLPRKKTPDRLIGRL